MDVCFDSLGLGAQGGAPSEGCVWIPDLVAWCWAELRTRWRDAYNQGMRPGSEDQLVDDEAIVWRDVARGSNGWFSPETLGRIATALAHIPANAEGKQLLELLVGLDRAADGLNLRREGYHPSTQPILQWWLENGNLARRAELVVLRKTEDRLVGGLGLADYLRNYSICDGNDWHFCVHRVPESVSFRYPSSSGQRALTIAFVPILRQKDDARFVSGRFPNTFSVCLHDPTQDTVECGLEKLVAELEDQHVDIALLPESCVSRNVAEALRLALKRNFDNQHSRGKLPSLKLAVVGVGRSEQTTGNSDLPALSAVRVFSGDGRTLFAQPKLQPWHLDEWQQRRYGVALPSTGNHCIEDIDIPNPPDIHLLEDFGLGRLIVLICEDLVRCKTSRQLAVDVWPTIVVGPVMDDSLETFRWAFDAARQMAQLEPNAAVLIVNSGWLSSLAGTRSRKASPEPGIGIKFTRQTGEIIRMGGRGLFAIQRLPL
jgi:hypothetical protein